MLILPFVSQTALIAAFGILARGCATESEDEVQVQVKGLPLRFPARVYYAEEDVREGCRAGGVVAQVALCMGTRHHDGYLRQQCVRDLLPAEEPWMVPFVLQLLGEYVVEISEHIDAAITDPPPARYVEFAAENPRYIQRLRQQATSYWNEYYRRTYPNRLEYPALRALARLGDLTA
ncbi:hypothetical protein [Stenotrophomonas bentonitica]|uniref:hypothetical protein n=1 Tax=Stenotrophomonas bentonitica TaxID=1450134 RepID=UPI00345EB262